jgi:hypothetical protein
VKIGTNVQNRLTGQFGVIARGPRRASRGMAWVLWDGGGRVRPVQTNKTWLVAVREYVPMTAAEALADDNRIEAEQRDCDDYSIETQAHYWR